VSKSFGHSAFFSDEPVYVLQRQPFPEKKQTRYEIWIEDDGIAITPSQLAQLLADTLQGVVKKSTPTNLIGEKENN
jgi:hypothetical protein